MSRRYQTRGSTAGPSATSDGETEILPNLVRRSLCRVLADAHYEDWQEAELRLALRDACERARHDRVRPEHLLIVIKDSWRDLPERRRLSRFDADEALVRVISACINEYYGEQNAAQSDSARSLQEADRVRPNSPGAEVNR